MHNRGIRRCDVRPIIEVIIALADFFQPRRRAEDCAPYIGREIISGSCFYCVRTRKKRGELVRGKTKGFRLPSPVKFVTSTQLPRMRFVLV